MTDIPPDREQDSLPDPDELGGLNIAGAFEAIVFASDHPVSSRDIAEALGIQEAEVESVAGELERRFERNNHGIMLQYTGEGWRLVTRTEYSEIVKRHLRLKQRTRLSRAALETISIVAYRQPVSRLEVEEIRGVDSSQVLRNLMERELVKITGRAELPGRPLLYGTTDAFLTYFGLDSLQSLPKPEELLGEQETLELPGNGPDGPFVPNKNPGNNGDEANPDE